MFPIHFQIPTIALRPFIQFYTQVEVSLRDPHDYDCLIRSLTEQNLSSGRVTGKPEAMPPGWQIAPDKHPSRQCLIS